MKTKPTATKLCDSISGKREIISATKFISFVLMTNETLLCCGRANLAASSVPISMHPVTVLSNSFCVHGDTRPLGEKGFSLSNVEKMLDSVRLSPTSSHNVLEKERFISSTNKRQEKNFTTRTFYRSTVADLSVLNDKLATIPQKGHSAESESRQGDLYDSFSDSTYSPRSDVSLNSDVGSLNTTSTDTDNKIFHPGLTPRDRFSALQQRADVRHIDEGFLKRVLMLMKVILYLRHNFPLQITRRKVFLEMEKNKKFGEQLSLCSNSSEPSRETNGLYTSKSPRTRKRISFSPSTLLFSAVTEHAVTEARSILEEEDIDVNALTPSGQSLLHIAAANADLKCVQLLLQYGAEVNVKDVNGWGPLHAAVRRGNWKSAILLIEAGADFAEYAQTRIQEYNQVLRMSRTCFRSVEIFV